MSGKKEINWKRIWYMLCFLAIGIVDQRKGSAPGEVQLAAQNAFGIVLATLTLPSLKLENFKKKIYICWTGICIVAGTGFGVWGRNHYLYKWQWILGVFNVAIWGYLIIYIFRERSDKEKISKNLMYICFVVMCLFMILSVHKGMTPFWMLLIFGSFYLIGIPKGNREDFFHGMLNGIILWFFLQQMLAYGFRPYDDLRYRGLYSGSTQNGLFYMIVYCAFLCKWIWAKQNKKSLFCVGSYFLLSAASISFLLLSGGRSALMGAAVATLIIYSLHDIVWKKSFYGWLGHILLFGLCVVISFPLVYGTVRYLPTVLRHPIWFEGEYTEWRSVRSFDPKDSERYTSFEEAVETNIGRILDIIGIDIRMLFGEETARADVLKVFAAEKQEPGRTPENPFVLEDTDKQNDISIRKTIFAYYFHNLNFGGHTTDESGFYSIDGIYMYHAHNMFLQMAYDYGIVAGILFLGLTVYALIRLFVCAFRGPENHKWICLAFFAAIIFYGMTEMAVNPGTISWSLLYILFCFAGEKEEGAGEYKESVCNKFT